MHSLWKHQLKLEIENAHWKDVLYVQLFFMYHPKYFSCIKEKAPEWTARYGNKAELLLTISSCVSVVEILKMGYELCHVSEHSDYRTRSATYPSRVNLIASITFVNLNWHYIYNICQANEWERPEWKLDAIAVWLCFRNGMVNTADILG